MRSFLGKFTAVQAVRLSGSTGSTGAVFQAQLVPGIGGQWANAVDSLAPTITGLSYHMVSHDGDYFTALTRFTALTTLYLDRSCRFFGVRGLESIVNLQTLDLSGASRSLTDDAFSSLSVLTNLTSLDLTYCRQLSLTGFATLAFFTALTSLNLAGTLADDSVLLGPVSGLSTLTRVKFSMDAAVEPITMIAVRCMNEKGITVMMHEFRTGISYPLVY